MILVQGKRGHLTVKSSKGRFLHSRVNPREEALSLATEQLSSSQVREGGLVLLDTGLPYLSTYLAEQFPATPQYIIHSDDRMAEFFLHRNPELPPGSVHWHPGDTASLEDTLRPWMASRYLRGVQLLQGRAVDDTAFAQESAQTVASTTAGIFTQVHRETMTRGFFGVKKLANLRKAVELLESGGGSLVTGVTRADDEKVPVLVASGPSLGQAASYLCKYRETMMIYALPSAISFLHSISMEPDVILTTDPGYWAGEHLRQIPSHWKSRIIAPLTAELGRMPGMGMVHFLPVSDPLTSLFLKPQGIRPGMRETGTVAAFALDLILEVHSKAVVIFGLDLSLYQLVGHITPHGFDTHLAGGSTRLNPLETIQTTRDLNTLAPGTTYKPRISQGSLEIYRTWFSRFFHGKTDRTFLRFIEGHPGEDLPCASREQVSRVLERASDAWKESEPTHGPGTGPLGLFDHSSTLEDYAVLLKHLESAMLKACTYPLNPEDPADELLQEVCFFSYKRYWSEHSADQRRAVCAEMAEEIHFHFSRLAL
ncbi:6-hydroxymethylpterin diphosphokinase MptE-like protein [Spirochaeta lutea]|uniref:6-hydroxymethylpterin diphosphokinase MptE-like domain-containing protein n=1 Tax=Spirochaeta lutea TaxID=1480694 RepID=A0A098QUL0_9SPIO|nr:6-hydroxymethylpterin diphosphokinase MptE-like protein [Spirochaeta lutea]KGE71369.1 hypothetical protein DC28_11205 [Spirochaeta lutea]